MITKETLDKLIEYLYRLKEFRWFEKCEILDADSLIITINQSYEHLYSLFGSRVEKDMDGICFKYSSNVQIKCIENNSDTSCTRQALDKLVTYVDICFTPIYKKLQISRNYIYFKEYEMETHEQIGDIIRDLSNELGLAAKFSNGYFCFNYKDVDIYF